MVFCGEAACTSFHCVVTSVAEEIIKLSNIRFHQTLLGVTIFADARELLDYMIPMLLEPAALKPNEVPLPWRVELKSLHKMQNQLQLVCLLGIIALCCKDVLSVAKNGGKICFFVK